MANKRAESGGNIFRELGFSPGDAENLKLRADLMLRLDQVIRDRGLTQTQAADLFGVTPPRVSDLVRGKIGLFSIDALVNMLERAGIRVKLRLAVSAGTPSPTGDHP